MRNGKSSVSVLATVPIGGTSRRDKPEEPY